MGQIDHYRGPQAPSELVNMAAYGHVTTVLTRDGRRLARIVPEEDAWVYSPAWQESLREADTDLCRGPRPAVRGRRRFPHAPGSLGR